MKYAKKQKPLKDDGFRIMWFVPLEMTMSGLALHVGLQYDMFGAIFWMVVLIIPIAVYLDQYMPYDTYTTIPMPLEEDYPDQMAWVKAIGAWQKDGPVKKKTVPGRPLPKFLRPNIRVRLPALPSIKIRPRRIIPKTLHQKA